MLGYLEMTTPAWIYGQCCS